PLLHPVTFSSPATSLHRPPVPLFLFPCLPPPTSTLFPYTTLFRSAAEPQLRRAVLRARPRHRRRGRCRGGDRLVRHARDQRPHRDRKSTRLNSSHVKISYAVFCLKKKKLNPDGT